MNRTGFLFLIPMVILYAVIGIYAASPDTPSVDIKGRRAEVDLSDIIINDKKVYTEIELRKLCAEITDRYSSLGYTGFRIRRAEIRKDGSVLIEFSEPVVEKITVKGAGAEDEEIAASLYKEGTLFNEFTLNQNIKITKERYSVTRIIVDLKRRQDDEIDIFASVERKMLSAGISAASHPVYGAQGSLSLELAFSSSSLKTELESSSGMNDAYSNRGALSYIYNTPGGTMLFLFGAEYRDTRDYTYDSMDFLFNEERVSFETSAGVKAGAISFLSGIFEEYSVYNSIPGIDNKFSFSGIAVSLNYDDRSLMLDPLDVTEGEVSVIYGWNHVESDTAVRIDVSGNISIPFTSFSSLTGVVDYRYTSEKNRIYHEYVFDSELPFRKDEFITSPWRGLLKAGVLFDLYNRLLYVSPDYTAGFYNRSGELTVVHAAGLRILIQSGLFSSEIACSIERWGNYENSVLSFSGSAGF